LKVFCPIITKNNNGGGIKSTISLVNGLSDNQIEVYLMIHPECEFLNELNDNIKITFFKQKPIVSIFRPIQFFKASNEVNNFIKSKNLEKEIILCSDRPALMLLNFSSYKYTNIVYVSRGSFYHNFSAKLLKIVVFPYLKAIVGISKRQLILASIQTKKNIINTVIFNGIKSLNNKPKPLNKQKITLAVIGGICKIKGQLQAVQLIEKLEKRYHISLKLYGTTFTKKDDLYKNEIETYIKNKNIKNVFFEGHNNNIAQIFENTDILLSTSISEGLGRTIIEAMSAGVPTVANEIAGAPLEIITHKFDGLLYDGSLNELENCVVSLLENNDLKDTITKNALNTYQNKFTEEIMINNYMRLFKQILNE